MGSTAENGEGKARHKLAVRPDEAAEMLGVSARTLFGWTKQGVVKCVKIGRAVLYRIEELERFLRDREQQN